MQSQCSGLHSYSAFNSQVYTQPASVIVSQSLQATYGTQQFDNKTELQELLEDKLPSDYTSKRQGPCGLKLTYVESWKLVELSNAIFGFDGWSCCITNLNVDFIDEDHGRFRVGVTAIVRVTLKSGSYHEDVGVGMAENPRKGPAIELAKKEAVSDGRKRALRLFGNYLGNSLYDKDYVKTIEVPKQKDITPVTYTTLREQHSQTVLRSQLVRSQADFSQSSTQSTATAVSAASLPPPPAEKPAPAEQPPKPTPPAPAPRPPIKPPSFDAPTPFKVMVERSASVTPTPSASSESSNKENNVPSTASSSSKSSTPAVFLKPKKPAFSHGVSFSISLQK